MDSRCIIYHCQQQHTVAESSTTQQHLSGISISDQLHCIMGTLRLGQRIMDAFLLEPQHELTNPLHEVGGRITKYAGHVSACSNSPVRPNSTAPGS